MRKRRSPTQTLIIAVAVGVGLVFGTRLVSEARSEQEADRRNRHLPDVELRDASPADLVAAGYRLGESAPKTWSGISIRLFEDEHGYVNCLRCQIDAHEVDALIHFPEGARTPADGKPPADWPWGTAGDRWQVPTWWQPDATAITRFYEEYPPKSLARGVYASYDPQTRVLLAWMWTRRWTPARPAPENAKLADAIAHVLVDQAMRDQLAADASGWFIRTGLDGFTQPVLTPVLPAGVERVDAALFPRRGQHRYLLRVVGISREDAETVAGGLPLRRLAEDGAQPDWSFAAPPAGLPEWFAVGPGPRWMHALRRLSDGAVEAGRWAAYDVQQKCLVVWDWTEDVPRPAACAVDALSIQ